MRMLPLFVVYRNTRDAPGKFVVRRWNVMQGRQIPDRDPLIIADDLTGARAAIPYGCINLGREADDDPAIVEVWI